MKCKRTWIVPVVWLAVPACILLCFGAGAASGPGQGPDQGLPPGYQRLLDARAPGEAAIIRRHLKVDSQMVDFSQHIREHVDFLLTPALLVQEAISDGVILTYPVE
ncbi:MAG: hypothetical protein RBR19_05375 [Sedimentisphaerales bacterium]|nr:hypothetical protein [Sedimentisphaerales bacterium]